MKKLFSLKTAILAFAVFALVGFAFSSSKAYADDDPAVAPNSAIGDTVTAKYDASLDAIIIKAMSEDAKVQILKFKDEQAASIKKAASELTVKSATPSAVSLTSKDGGIKMGVNKDTFLMIAGDFKEKKTTGDATANIKINASTVKKITMDLNYAKAGSSDPAVAALYVTSTEPQAKPEEDKVYSNYEYAIKYKDDDAPSPYYPLEGGEKPLTGKVLEELISGDKKVDILVRKKGTDAPTLPSKEGVRPSAAKKISVKKMGKLAVVKFSTKTGLLAIKNGYDFSVQTSTDSAIKLEDWKTILRTNKNGEAGSEFVATNTYTPVKFAAGEAAKTYTKERLKGLSFARILKESGKKVGSDEGFYVYVRKSATEKAPASEFVSTKGFYHVNPITAAPKAVSLSAITSGASVKVKLEKDTEDETPAGSVVFEYAIVKKDGDYKDDSLVWKAFKGTELTIKAANKKTSKYLKADAAADAKAAAADATLDECYILVRRQAALSDKAAKIKDQGLDVYQPSKILTLEVTLGENSKNKPVVTEVKAVK